MTMSQPISFKAVRQLAAKALSEGGERVAQTRVKWAVAHRCEAPVTVELFARPQQFTVERSLGAYRIKAPVFSDSDRGGYQGPLPVEGFQWDKGMSHPLTVEMEVPCRRCHSCLERRARIWAHKAKTEIEAAPRTWFCTFTLTPHEHFMAKCRAALLYAKSSAGDFEAASPEEQFRARCEAIGPELTRYMKRVRKNSGAKIRYLIVAERHKSGLPHYHALVHEVGPASPLRKRHLKDAWRMGFSDCRLITDPRAAWYVCKYLSKDMATRVRGSLLYGVTAEGGQTTLVDSKGIFA